MYIYTEDDDRWMRAERAARERNQDVSDKVTNARIEVAREIFEEIDRALNLSKCYGESGIYFEHDIEADIAELKKKHTENENG